MIAATIGPFGDAHPHARWLHELRSVVSTASVAAAMGRRLLRDDAASAEAVLGEAEDALSQCRDLLAAAGEHVRVDVPGTDSARPCKPGRGGSRERSRGNDPGIGSAR